MRPTALAVSLLVIAATSSSAQASAAHAGPPALKWGPAPAVFPVGAQMAVLQGNPGAPGLFTVRLRFPNGYRIAPHTHPTDEHVTVMSGSLRLGMGNAVDEKLMTTLNAGGFVTAPAKMAHYVQARGTTVVPVHAEGPFALTYVNPADTPKAISGR